MSDTGKVAQPAEPTSILESNVLRIEQGQVVQLSSDRSGTGCYLYSWDIPCSHLSIRSTITPGVFSM